MAGFVRDLILKNSPEEYLSSSITPLAAYKILKPNKKTVLHDFLESQFENELEYIARKTDEVEIFESLLKDYNIYFSIDEIDLEEENYSSYLVQKIIDNILTNLTNETFQILFSDRMFCLQFNKIIAEVIHSYKLKEHSEILKKDGVTKRCNYFPVWVSQAVFFRDKGCCAVCLSDLSGLLKTGYNKAIDHIVPLNLGGINDITNFQLICKSCNSKKSGHATITSELYPAYF
jgi:hypothetical protein